MIRAAVTGTDAELWTAGRAWCFHCKYQFDTLKHYAVPNSDIECPMCKKRDSGFIDFKQLQARIEKLEREN